MVHSIFTQSPSAGARRMRGFTLIELLVVVTIVGILAAIALPSYQQYVMKGRRVDAKNAVLDLAAREERFFATNNRYSNLGTELKYAANFPMDVNATGVSYYALSVTVTGTGGFIATATPKGAQVTDACSAYSVDNLGRQTNVNADTSAVTITGCW